MTMTSTPPAPARDSFRESRRSTQLPHDRDVEEALLGGMLFSREVVAETLAVVGAEDFYFPANAAIFEAIIGLYASGSGIDVITVAAALARHGTLELAGGKDFLAHLARSCPMPLNVRHYAEQIAELAALRALVHALNDGQIAALAGQPSRDIAERVLTGTYDAVSRFERRASVRDITQITTLIADEIDAGTVPRLISTGYGALDRVIGGLRPGALVTLAARPGMGKSSLALCIAAAVAGAGEPVVFSSLEMSDIQLGERLLSVMSRVPSETIQSRRLAPKERVRFDGAKAALAGMPLVIDDGATTILELRARIQKTALTYGRVGLVVVDYLQLLAPKRANDNRAVEVSELSRSLKLLANDFQVPLVALSQLNRQTEYRTNKRPMLSDLRESGSIEQDSDQVVFIYREDHYDPNTPRKGLADIIVAKNRHGGIASIELGWDPATTRFSSL